MREWEFAVIESKSKSWIVTTTSGLFLCSLIGGEFIVKSPSKKKLSESVILKAIKI